MRCEGIRAAAQPYITLWEVLFSEVGGIGGPNISNSFESICLQVWLHIDDNQYHLLTEFEDLTPSG